MKSKNNYASSGVDYQILDSLKRLSQKAAENTNSNFDQFNLKVVSQSRGESAFVWEEADSYRAFVIEGLGTKNLVAEQLSKITQKSYYRQIAQDTIAAIVNDIITVGALPQVINAYFATGGSGWFSDQQAITQLVEGWEKACNMAGAVWGGGETPALPDIIYPQTIDLAGSCIGIIKPKSRLLIGDKIKDGDAILLIESSGISANGLTLARKVADQLPQKYTTPLSDGTMYGETLLTPSFIYVTLIKQLFDEGVNIHYIVNITGHGLRKLMRATQEFAYIIDTLPPTPQIFDFIQKQSGSDDYSMYGTFNMGAGLAIYLPLDQLPQALEIASKNNFKAWKAGSIQKGSRTVEILPKKIIYKDDTLEIRN